MVAPVFTPGQLTFISRYAQQTGLNPQVVAAQVFNEMNGSYAAQRQATGDHDWLNIGRTDAGPRGAGAPVWNDPISAADASANWIKGTYSVPGFGKADPRITNILQSVGQGPAAQIAALQQSPWASSHYPNLPDVYQTVSGTKLPNVPTGGGAVPVSAGVPRSGAAPFPAPEPPALVPPVAPTATPNYTNALLSTLNEGPGALLNALIETKFAPQAAPVQQPQLPFETASMPPPSSPPGVPAPAAAATPPADPDKWVKMSSGADRSGVPTNQPVFDAVARIARQFGKPLTITTGTNHNQYVVNTHRESQHWQGNAADILYGYGTGPDNVDPALTRLGRAALIAAGMDPKEAAKQDGGVFNVNGWNILFNTGEGGNHYNHLHVGV